MHVELVYELLSMCFLSQRFFEMAYIHTYAAAAFGEESAAAAAAAAAAVGFFGKLT